MQSELSSHCKDLSNLAELVVDETKHALRLVASQKQLSPKEEKLVASSFAAGISQIALIRMPLISEAIRLEMPAYLV